MDFLDLKEIFFPQYEENHQKLNFIMCVEVSVSVDIVKLVLNG